jgi:hypothetical protein
MIFIPFPLRGTSPFKYKNIPELNPLSLKAKILRDKKKRSGDF